MFKNINDKFNASKNAQRDLKVIMESVLGDDEDLLSDDEDDLVDGESIPAEIYKTIDDALDKIVDSPDFDDTEIDELLDDDELGDDDGDSDGSINVIIDECVSRF